MNGKIELILYQDGRAPVAVTNPAPTLIENSYGPMSIASALMECKRRKSETI